jgi:hypothetical protein
LKRLRIVSGLTNTLLLRIFRFARLHDAVVRSNEQRTTRAAQSKPAVDVLGTWLRAQCQQFSPKHETAQAVDYMPPCWVSFSRFPEGGQICLMSNAAEREIRGLMLGVRTGRLPLLI